MTDDAADELSKTTWRDDQWLTFYPLNVFTALDYFALSPFYDRSCNNEVAKAQGGNVNLATLPPGVEYELQDAQEPHLFVIKKQQRSGPKATSPLQYYYILDGNVYQAPSLHAALSSRLTRCLYGVRAAFKLMHNDLDPLSVKGGPGADGEHAAAPAIVAPKQLAAAEKEQMRKADRIIMSVLQKYPMPTDGAAAAPAYVPQDSAVPSSGDGQAGRAEPAADSVSMPSAI